MSAIQQPFRTSRSTPHRISLFSIILTLLHLGSAMAVAAGPPTTPGWGVPAQFANKASYWNPAVDGIQNSTESTADQGGTWLVPAGPPIPRLTGLITIQQKTVEDECGQQLTGDVRRFTLNGLHFKCFVPSGIKDSSLAEKIWVLDMPSTNNGTMHQQQTEPQKLLRFSNFATCTHDHDQAGRPLNTVVNGYWALAKFLPQKYPNLVDKIALTGGSFGSYSALMTAIRSAGDPEVKLTAVYGSLALGAPRYLDLRTLVEAKQDVLAPNQPHGPWGEDLEVLRTFQASTNTKTIEQIDPLNYIDQLKVSVTLLLPEEDFTLGDLHDVADQIVTTTQAAGNDRLFKIYSVLFGSHTADGPIEPYFLGDGNDWYNGATPHGFDVCRDYNAFVANEVAGKPIPTTTPIDITAPQTAHDRVISRELNPDLGIAASGPLPGLLTFDQRLGYGSQLGSRDTMFALDSGQAEATDLVVANGEGEVMRLTVHAAGTISQVWKSRVGYRPHAILRVNDRVFVAAMDGRARLLNLATGSVVVAKPPGHTGQFPDLPVLGTAYDALGNPSQLIFLTNRFAPTGEAAEIVGLDPITLDRQFSTTTVGAFNTWDFFSHPGGSSAWIGLMRGHGIRVKLVLPDEVELEAVTDYIDDTPQTLTVVDETVLLTGKKGQYWFDGAGDLLPPPAGGEVYFATGGTEPGLFTPTIIKPIPGTTLMMWFNPGEPHRAGLSDVAQLVGATAAVPPIASGPTKLEAGSFVHQDGRFFATTPNGTFLEFHTAAPAALVASALHVPSGAISWGLDPQSKNLLFLDVLEEHGTSLVEVDFGAAANTVQVIDHGFQVPRDFQWGQLQAADGFYYVGIGADLAMVGGQTTLFTSRTHFQGYGPDGDFKIEDVTLGHLTAFQQFIDGEYPTQWNLDGQVAGTRLRYPQYLWPYLSGMPAPRSYGQHTNSMQGHFNLGHQVRTKVDDEGHVVVYHSSSGKVIKRTLNSVTGDEITAVSTLEDLGWWALGLEFGTHDGREVLFVGTALSHAAAAGTNQAVTGHTFVLDDQDLKVLKVLDTGLASWGIKQVDLDNDGQPETIVGSATRLHVYDQQLQLLFSSAPLTTFHGAYGLIIPLDGDEPCDWQTQQSSQQSNTCVPDRLAVGTTGGLTFYTIHLP